MYRVLGLLCLLITVRAQAQPVLPSFMVYFDWDRATLTYEGQRIIHQAADVARHLRATVEVDGFTDTSGTIRYNQGLSWHRAQNVAAELARDGVPPSAIKLLGYGETFPRVPTPDDVREVQNRRVGIVVRSPPVLIQQPPVAIAVPYPWGVYRRPYYWRGWYR